MAYDLGTAHGTIELEYTGKKAVDAADRDMDKLKGKSKDTDKALAKLGATLKGLGKGVKFGAIGVGLASAAAAAANLGVQLLGMVAPLTSILSLSSAVPGALVGIVAAVGVLKAAFAGVEDAVKAAFDTENPEKFDEVIKKLSPAAQDFAKALQANVPELVKFQQGLQESFFQGGHLSSVLVGGIGALKSLQPQLRGVAGDLGKASLGFARFALSADTLSFVRASITSLRTALHNISPAMTPLLEGLRSVGTVGLPLLDKLSASVGNVGQRFGEWLSAISSDGRLQAWIDTALATLKTLGDIAKNVGSILQSVFSAASATGGGLLNTISQITGQFATFLKSTEGKAAITALFTGIATVARELAPILTTLAGALAGALGPALEQLATGVGPALLEVVQALAPAFGPLAGAIAAVATAIAPILPPVAQLVAMLVTLGAGVLTSIATNLQPVIELLGGAMSGALASLAPVLEQVVAMLPGFATAGLQLAQALLPLVPSLIEFATALSTALLPYLPQIMANVQQLIPPLIELATLFAGQLAGALQAVIPYIPMIVEAIVNLQGTILTMLTVGVQLLNFIVRLGQFFLSIPGIIGGAIAAFVSLVVGGFNTVKTAVSTGITTVIGFFTSLPGRIGSALAALPGLLFSLGTNALNRLAFAFGQGIGIVLSLAINTPRRIGAALASLGPTLVGLAQRAWAALRGAFSAGISNAASLAHTLPGRVRGAISSLGGILSSLARAAWAALRNAFSSGISNAASLASSLPGRIRSAVGNLGGLLVSAGADAIRGLVNGIRGAIGSAVSAAADAGRAVISGIKSTLHISSPSKEMIKIGRFVTQGLRIGLLGTAKQVQAASTKLANYVRDAFSDKLISRGQRNSVLNTLAKGTAQMKTLVNRANSASAKLKTSQANLAAVQKSYNETLANAVKQTKDTFNVVTPGQTFVNLDLTKERFTKAVAQAKQFAKDIQVLTKRGLSKDLLQQLVDAGAADGGAMARALATANTATIKEFNGLQGQLNSSANAVGKVTADALYGAGLRAAQGLVKGLQSQEKALEAQMVRIANSMVAAIKKALKIKSPSRIMFNLGQFTSEGLKEGIESLRRQVQQAAQRLATASILPTVQLTTQRSVASSQRALAGTTVGGTVNNFSQTVNALPGMNAKAVADYGLAKLRLSLSGGISATPIPAPATAGV